MLKKMTTHCHKLFGLWRWRIKDEDGNVLAQSPGGYETKEMCLQHAAEYLAGLKDEEQIND